MWLLPLFWRASPRMCFQTTEFKTARHPWIRQFSPRASSQWRMINMNFEIFLDYQLETLLGMSTKCRSDPVLCLSRFAVAILAFVGTDWSNDTCWAALCSKTISTMLRLTKCQRGRDQSEIVPSDMPVFSDHKRSNGQKSDCSSSVGLRNTLEPDSKSISPEEDATFPGNSTTGKNVPIHYSHSSQARSYNCNIAIRWEENGGNWRHLLTCFADDSHSPLREFTQKEKESEQTGRKAKKRKSRARICCFWVACFAQSEEGILTVFPACWHGTYKNTCGFIGMGISCALTSIFLVLASQQAECSNFNGKKCEPNDGSWKTACQIMAAGRTACQSSYRSNFLSGRLGHLVFRFFFQNWKQRKQTHGMERPTLDLKP